jgi:hypothetical protein
MKTIALLAICAASACSGASSPATVVHSTSSSGAPLSGFRTFAFGLPEATPGGYEVSSISLGAEPHLQLFVADALQERGYVEDKAHPDLIVRFGSGTRSVPDIPRHEVDTLERIDMDLYDASAKTEVWHGSATLRFATPHLDDGLLQPAVQRTFTTLPALNGAAIRHGVPPFQAEPADTDRQPPATLH